MHRVGFSTTGNAICKHCTCRYGDRQIANDKVVNCVVRLCVYFVFYTRWANEQHKLDLDGKEITPQLKVKCAPLRRKETYAYVTTKIMGNTPKTTRMEKKKKKVIFPFWILILDTLITNYIIKNMRLC